MRRIAAGVSVLVGMACGWVCWVGPDEPTSEDRATRERPSRPLEDSPRPPVRVRSRQERRERQLEPPAEVVEGLNADRAVAALESADRAEVAAALEALGLHVADADAQSRARVDAQVLRLLAETVRPTARRAGLLYLYTRRQERPLAPGVLEAARELTRHRSPELRAVGIRLAAVDLPPKQRDAELIEALQDPSPLVREVAGAAIGESDPAPLELGSQQALQAALARERVPAVQAALAQGLALRTLPAPRDASAALAVAAEQCRNEAARLELGAAALLVASAAQSTRLQRRWASQAVTADLARLFNP